jgi:rhamnogalacturonan I rhamnosyltransferase
MAKQRASPAAAIRRRISGPCLLRWAGRITFSVVAWMLLFHLFSFLGLNRLPLHVTRLSCMDARNNSISASAAASVVATGAVGHLALLPRSE